MKSIIAVILFFTLCAPAHAQLITEWGWPHAVSGGVSEEDQPPPRVISRGWHRVETDSTWYLLTYQVAAPARRGIIRIGHYAPGDSLLQQRFYRDSVAYDTLRTTVPAPETTTEITFYTKNEASRYINNLSAAQNRPAGQATAATLFCFRAVTEKPCIIPEGNIY